ncbi:chromosome partitioning protein ParA [Nesterenkonia sp. AN1]|uniref:ParA family protein n=1 Tax=Nesterenkonia TaxID=57494 RepID=UPI0004502BDE|nr:MULTISPECIES: ParA family protein [Nesterenkonia]EXF24468.1 chromosome partitioning protein ParA [Nesterenkonia sp. AN1]
MQILSVSSLKGGVGKTSVTMGLASAALHQGVRTLVVDLDPHADSTTGLAVTRGTGTEAGQLLRDAKRTTLSDHVVRSGWLDLLPAEQRSEATLDVVVGSALSAAFDRPDIRPRDMRRLRMILDRVSGYDLVLIDCPPSLAGLTRIGWSASDGVLLVAEPSLFSVAGTERTMRAIRMFSNEYAPQLKSAGVVVNRARADSAEHEYRLLEMERLYKDKLMLPVLEENPFWQQIQGAAYPVHQWPGEQVKDLAKSFDQLLKQLV